jgi:hypothetical protein
MHRLSLASLVLSLSLCPPQSKADKASVIIIVEDVSGAVVANADVEVRPAPPDSRSDFVTGNDGKFSLLLPLGGYDVLVKGPPGFEKSAKHIEVENAETQTINIQLQVGMSDGPAGELLTPPLTPEPVYPNVFPASFPKESNYASPDKRHVIVGINSDHKPYHTVFLRDAVHGTQHKLFTYGRSINLLWNANSATFAVTDYVGSDSSQVSAFSVDEQRAPVRVLDLLLDELPEDARKKLRTELTNHHVYVEASAWLAPTVLSVRISGYGDANPNGFHRLYRVSLPESWASH